LTGRIGEDAPAEHIIASIVAFTTIFSLPLSIPFAHRYSRRVLTRGVVFLATTTIISMAVFSMKSPFDSMHQKRLFVIHMDNITTQEQRLHVAAADGAPGFEFLARNIATEFSISDAVPTTVIMNEWNSEWDTLYPFSSFLSPYKFDLPIKPEYIDAPEHDFSVSAINEVVDKAAGTRSFTLVVRHPGIIWTAVAFDAHVLKWTLDDNPPDEYVRHHIKEASFYGVDSWSVDLVVKLPVDGDAGVKVDFVGIHEKAMWPGKKAEKEHGGRAMKFFEEFDDWLEKESAGTVDALLLGCVGGVATV